MERRQAMKKALAFLMIRRPSDSLAAVPPRMLHALPLIEKNGIGETLTEDYANDFSLVRQRLYVNHGTKPNQTERLAGYNY